VCFIITVSGTLIEAALVVHPARSEWLEYRAGFNPIFLAYFFTTSETVFEPSGVELSRAPGEKRPLPIGPIAQNTNPCSMRARFNQLSTA